MGVITHKGDAVKWARKYKRTGSPLFHALLCDAPYEMDFMGKGWDGTGVAFDPDTWEAFAGVLHPGAFLFVFAGTINDDLISVAMRKAGLRKFHKIMGWAYGSGFPKASRINYSQESEWLAAFVDIPEIFSGHRYGLQALKPAIETILVFQKPYEGKPIDDITQTGAGALNIEGGRIGTDGSDYLDKSGRPGGGEPGNGGTMGPGWNNPLTHATPAESGRWPSNFLLLDPEAARALDEQSGSLPSSYRDGDRGYHSKMPGSVRLGSGRNEIGFSDSGGASRFFFQVSDQIDEADPVFYCAKASRRERDAGIAELDDMADAQRYGSIRQDRGPGYEEGSRARNPHPTVKPLSLTRYLATLLLPPALYAPRRLFVPFAGVGSEQIGGALAGWEEIEGVEVTEEYIPINRARVNYWTLKSKEPIEKSNGSKARSNGHKKPNQLELI